MMIAVTGSQGTGKSTTLSSLAVKGYDVVLRKTSRSILSDWGFTLDEINRNAQLTVQFQEEILKRKIADDRSFDGRVCFTERTPIDLLVYATVTLGPLNGYNDWLTDYGDRCVAATQSCYDGIVFLEGGLFPITEDGTRGANPFYGKLVDSAMEQFYNDLINLPSISIGTADQLNRISIITSFVDQIAAKQITNGDQNNNA